MKLILKVEKINKKMVKNQKKKKKIFCGIKLIRSLICLIIKSPNLMSYLNRIIYHNKMMRRKVNIMHKFISKIN